MLFFGLFARVNFCLLANVAGSEPGAKNQCSVNLSNPFDKVLGRKFKLKANNDTHNKKCQPLANGLMPIGSIVVSTQLFIS